jgi:hypothetical protein
MERNELKKTSVEKAQKKLLQDIVTNCSMNLNLLREVFSILCDLRKLVYSDRIDKALEKLDFLTYQLLNTKHNL